MPIIATTDTSELGCVSCGYPCKIKTCIGKNPLFSNCLILPPHRPLRKHRRIKYHMLS